MQNGTLLLLAIIVFIYAGSAVKGEEREQFYGGSLSYKVKTKPDGRYMLDIELITGWVIGKGPCGFNCTKADIGRSTKATRQAMLSAHEASWLGTFHADYMVNGRTVTPDINNIVMANFTEKVLALSETAGWEQVLFKTSFDMIIENDKFDINYDGHSWKQLPLQAASMDVTNLFWHFQITVSDKLRNDTGKLNNCPHSIARPFYRVNLGQVTAIRIPTVDADGDFIKCSLAQYVEGGALSSHPPPNVTIAENCIIYINALEANGYRNDTWIGVPVSVADYNRKKITYGTEGLEAGAFPLSKSTVQFLVQVLANLSTPVFVDPTFEGNHNFILYADTIWRTSVYAEAVINTTIEEFSTIVTDNENVTLSRPFEQDSLRPQVKFTTMTWKPLAGDLGRHILCVQVTDDTGVDSTEMRCFTLDVLADTFSHATTATPGKPYFVDIPSPEQFVNCKLQATCVVPLYIHGDVEVTEVRIESSNLDKNDLSPIELVNHHGVQLYKVDFSFAHSLHGKESICFRARDINGILSEVLCIQSRIEPPDACLSAPCKNGGTCHRDEDTGGFMCDCYDRFTGKLCETRKDDPCNPDPCNPERAMKCLGIAGYLCFCKQGWEGDYCERSKNDCPRINTCSGHGTCTDKHLNYTCNCFSRYSGKDCEHDNCPSDSIDELTCPLTGCSPNPCQGDGICSVGGVCSCSYGYSGNTCSTTKCSLSGTVTGVAIIPPTMLDRSQWTCYNDNSTVEPCNLRIYMTTQSGSKPNIVIDTTSSLKPIISAGPVNISPDIPGTSNVFSADILIQGILKNTEHHYVCVTANEGTNTTSRCFEMKFVQNPYKDPRSNRYPQRNAAVKFTEPTLKDHSRIMCTTSNRCSVLLYTSFTSTRSSCLPNAGGGTSSSGSPGCDQYDQDNDAGDANATATDPCCSHVVSSSTEVNVYKAHPRGPSCVSEASFTFASPGEKEICFQSAESKNNSQLICYTVDVYDPNADPCSSSPCMNNGHCFHDGHAKFQCICPENYIGKTCEQGPCQPGDNVCQHGAYCLTNNGTNTCICTAGYSGPQCAQGPSSLNPTDTLMFTDTAKPTTFTCVQSQRCSLALILSGKPGSSPNVSAGYVSPSILLESVDAAERPSVPGSFQAIIRLKAKELGMQDLCIQSKDSTGVNKDEICFKVNVISDVVSVYSFKDRPYFVDPSLPTDSKLECPAGEACHVLFHATVGAGNEHECLVVRPKLPAGFSTAHLFTTCETCTPGVSSNVNCSVDVSIVNAPADVGTLRHICLSLALKSTNITGEERCFDLTVTGAPVKTGCQVLECKNGGFCDGHIANKSVCYCPSGFSGNDCATAITSSSGSQTKTFLGDFSIPSEIKCFLGEECTIPFQLTATDGIRPVVSLGFASPPLSVEKPQFYPQSGSSKLFQGFAQAHPTKIGTYKVCLQADGASKTEAEMCVDVDVIGRSANTIDKNQPYFVAPTTPDGSTVLCQINKACHLDMHFTKGDMFGQIGICPSVTDTSTVPVQGIHIFDAVSQSSDCSSDIYYQTNNTGIQNLCVQVSLPAKRGETRCYIIKTVVDLEKEVESPCQGKICQFGGKCLADLSTSPATASCVCAAGYGGIDCSSAKNKSSTLPGVENLNGTQTGTQHFSDKGAIPKDVKCFVGELCCVNILFYGDKDKPPVDGFVSSSLAFQSKDVFSPFTSEPDLHLFQTCYKANNTGNHTLCLQTTVDGTNTSTNVDEICTAILTESGARNHTTVSQFHNTIPDGSNVTCPTSSTCHKTIITSKNSSGSCLPVKECGDGVKGVYVFETFEKDGHCFTDMAINTEGERSVNICVSAGKGGEEQHLQVEIKDRTEYGPCQKLHCLNRGVCIANASASCKCEPNYTGTHCETIHCQQDNVKALEHAKEMVITGYASCFCIVNEKKVHVIKKRPVVPKEKLIKAAGFGAGGMAGTMVVGVVVYAVVSKIRQPPEKKKPTPRPKSRVHPNNP